ncbi:MAG TPA: mevalonate kinase [Anaerolineales bacterium]|nr:mevalonate kinase [Anaerolineales bacterium]
MTTTRASAPGKIILFGEHAVVYGQPALAVPVTQVQATAAISLHPSLPSPPGTVVPEAKRSGAQAGEGGEGGFWIEALNLNRRYRLSDAPPDDVLSAAVRLTCVHVGLPIPTGVSLSVDSTIPIASGLGSGAAVCAAVVRALTNYLDYRITNDEVSALVFETEKLLHGTPSGIDNTVIAYGQPVCFVKGQPPAPFKVAHPFRLLIADTGLPSPTKVTVGDVRAAWQQEPERYEQIFRAIGDIVREARAVIEVPQTLKVSETFRVLGNLMNRNHALLQRLDVSCPELDGLISASLDAGASGGKLSGGGRGGNMIALVSEAVEGRVRVALEASGAKRVVSAVISEQ